MATPPTILAVKQAFLEQETRRLAQPLAPSRAWQRSNRERRRSSSNNTSNAHANSSARRDQLPEKVVDDALFRANQLLRQHVRCVYAPQAVRHVAEQLDQLYWQTTERAVGGDQMEVDGGSGSLNLGVDFSLPSSIAALPAAWEDATTAEAMPLEARRYAELVTRLQDLSAQQTAAAARVHRLQQLSSMVEPLRRSLAEEAGAEAEREDTNALQDNVVTRSGPLEQELERMRLLLARVGDRVAALQKRGGGELALPTADPSISIVDHDVEAVGRKRVQSLLENF